MKTEEQIDQKIKEVFVQTLLECTTTGVSKEHHDEIHKDVEQTIILGREIMKDFLDIKSKNLGTTMEDIMANVLMLKIITNETYRMGLEMGIKAARNLAKTYELEELAKK